METSTIALLRMSKKKQRHKTPSNQANRLKFVLQKKICQTCDPLTETQKPSDQKNVINFQNMVCFCLKWLTDICHLKSKLCNLQELMDYASLEVKNKIKVYI